MHTRTPLYQSVHEKFEVSSFTSYKDMIEAKFKNVSRDSDHAPSEWFVTVG